jgi:hypothetical protein
MKIVQFLMCIALIFFNVAFAQNASNASLGQNSGNYKAQTNLDLNKFAIEEERFCVVILIQGLWYGIRATTYSTFKVSDCSTKQINALNSASVSAQLAPLYNKPRVIVRGPYYGTMNVNDTQILNPYISLGTLKFSEMAVSLFTWLDALTDTHSTWRWMNAEVAYNPIKTIQNFSYIWFAGTRVYLIKTEKGEVFLMSSTTHEIKYTQNGINLNNLGDFLNLPEGWTYETKVLDKVLSMKAELVEGYSFKRMVDEFDNIYVEVFDKSLKL